MATEVISTIKSSGGDYTSLTAWESGEQTNLVTADQIAVAECYDDFTGGLEDNFAVSGWTTDATRYVKITAPPAQRHNGTPRALSGVGFLLWDNSAANGVLRIAQNHVVVDGLEVFSDSTSVPSVFVTNGAGTLTFTDCLLHSNRTGTGYEIQGASSSSVSLTMRGCAVWSPSRSMDARNATSVIIDNCVFWRHADQIGVLLSSTATVNNSYCGKASGSTEDWFTGSTPPAGSNNASSDSTASVDYTSSLTSKAGSACFVSVTSGAEDFHLASGSDLIGAGVNLYGTFTTDIDGDSWPSSGAWDIGFDYVASGGGTTVSVTHASETDTAQSISAIAGSVTVSVGHATETETAQSITPVQSAVVSVGHATETDAAQSIAVVASSTISVGHTVETDTAQAITPVLSSTVAVGHASETDSAQNITAIVSGSNSVGHASETDTAQSIAPVPGAVTVSIGAATETSSAQAIAVLASLTVSLGTATEVGTVGAITPVPGGLIVSLNAASETDSAQSITVFVPGVMTLTPISRRTLHAAARVTTITASPRQYRITA